MTIDWQFRISDIAIILTLLLYTFRAGSFTESVKSMQKRIESLEEVTKGIGTALSVLAVQKSQMERIERDIHEIKHGHGFVRQVSGGIDREYPS